MVMPAARNEGRAQRSAGQVLHGNTHETSSADPASSANRGPVTVATGTAEYTDVPPRTWRSTPNQLSASQPASSIAQLGRGARGSSVSSRTTASVAAVPPAIAVSTTPPDSMAAIAADRARRETTACGQARGWRARRTAAGAAIITPNANVTPSILMSKPEPKPSGPSVSSTEERTGTHTAVKAARELNAPIPAATRPRSIPVKPRIAITAATTRGRTTGPRTATDGTGLGYFTSPPAGRGPGCTSPSPQGSISLSPQG